MAFDLFPDFFDRPEGMRFVQQEKDERIELLLRQHWIINIPWIVAVIVGLFLPLLIINFNGLVGFSLLFELPPQILLGMLVIYYLLLMGYAIESFFFWYFNIYIVTNLHLVDINFRSLLARDITENRLDDIQSISSNIKGIIRSFFNFGDVLIETAAERQLVNFNNIPFPDVVADRIQDLQERQEKKGGKGDVS